MKTLLLISLIVIGCLHAGATAAPAKTDAEIRKQLLGFWRSPRHDYEFKSDGIIYMRPTPPCTTTNSWSVKGGRFIWDGETNIIVSLTAKKFVYRSLTDKIPGGFVLVRITGDLVGKPYSRESVR